MFFSSRLRLIHKVALLVIVPLVFELLFLTVLVLLLNHVEEEVAKESHAKLLIASASQIPQDFYQAGSTMATYAISRGQSFADKYETIAYKIPVELRTLEILVVDNQLQYETLQKIEESAADGLELFHSIKREIEKSPRGVLMSNFAVSKIRAEILLDSLMRNVESLTEVERSIESGSPYVQAKARAAITTWLLVGVVANIVLALLLAIFIQKEMTSRLTLLMENTSRIVEKKELNPLVTGSDEISQLDKVIHKMAGDLDAAAQYKQELISMVSHDLRTPLTSVSASLELVSSGALGSVSKKVENEVEAARRNSKRLIALINDLLDIEKIEAGKLELVLANYSVSEIIELAIDSVDVLLKDKQIEIDFNSDLQVMVDRQRMIQVLVNLLSNAIKFSPDNSTISITVEDRTNKFRLSVKDQGCGIPADQQAGIFDRFQQVREENQSSKTKYGAGSSGLGLAICRAIVEAHKGQIGVSSEVEVGSEFWIEIPNQLFEETGKPA